MVTDHTLIACPPFLALLFFRKYLMKKIFDFVFFLVSHSFAPGEAGAIVKIENKQQQQQLESIASKMEENASPWPPPAKQLNNKYFVNQAQTRTIQNNGSSEMPTNTTDTKVNKYFARKNTVSLTDEINQITESMPSTKLHIWTTTDTPITNTKYPHHNAIVNGSTSRTGSTHFQIAQKQLILSKNVHTEPPPMLNHILDSLSVSNSKHLHHDSRFVLRIQFYFCIFFILNAFSSDEIRDIRERNLQYKINSRDLVTLTFLSDNSLVQNHVFGIWLLNRAFVRIKLSGKKKFCCFHNALNFIRSRSN